MTAIYQSMVHWGTEDQAGTEADDRSAAVGQHAFLETVELLTAAGKARRIHHIHKQILVPFLRPYPERLRGGPRSRHWMATLYRKLTDLQIER